MYLTTIQTDLLEYTSETLKNKIDVIVTSPPYKTKDGYSRALMTSLGRISGMVLKPGGRMFLNFGQLREGFFRPYEALSDVACGGGLVVGQTIAWIKSIAMPDPHCADKSILFQRGHYQPINSDKILNYCWEPIFTLYKPPEPNFDRLSIGVRYADESNLKRGTRGKNGNLHCRGDAWFIPYKTTGSKEKKQHQHEYPEALVEKCLRVSGVQPGGTVLEPFCGSGTTAVVAKRMGLNAVVIDRDEEALQTAQSRWDKVAIDI